MTRDQPRLVRRLHRARLRGQVMALAVRGANPALRVARAGEQGGFAAGRGQQLRRRHQGGPGEGDVGLEHGPRHRGEDQGAVAVLGHAGDLDARAQVAAPVQLGEDALPAALHRFLLEQRAPHLGRDVRRGGHALDPPSITRAHVAGKDGHRPVEARVDHGLDVAEVHQVLAHPVGIVEHVPVRRLVADARPGARHHVGELAQAALHARVADVHPVEFPGLAHDLRRPEADALPERVDEGPIPALLELRGELHPGAEAEQGLVVGELGVAEADRVDEPQRAPDLLAEGEARGRLAFPGQQLGLDLDRVQAEVDELLGHRAGEPSGQERGRLLADDPGPGVQGDVEPPGGDEARDLALGERGVGAEGELGRDQRSGGHDGHLVIALGQGDEGGGADGDLGVGGPVERELSALDRELALLQLHLPALADVEPPVRRGLVHAAAQAQRAFRLELGQVVADQERVLGGDADVEPDRLQQARPLAHRLRRDVGGEQALLQEDVGIVEAALRPDLARQQQVAGAPGEGELRVHARLQLVEDLVRATGARRPGSGSRAPGRRARP